MATDPSIDLLRRLSTAAGPPGAEDEVRDVVRRLLAPLGRLSYDRLGSVLCELDGTADKPRIAITSHLDEVGFMVQSLTDDGGVKFVPLGGWWGHVLLGQRVDILTRDGRIPGVIGSKPPHFLSAKEREQVVRPDAMFIDVGASGREQVEALGVCVGDPVVPSAEFRSLAVDGVWSGKAFDNRIGVAVMCEALTALAEGKPPGPVIGIGAVQEELGARGAGPAVELARPDVALVLECTPADDMPPDKRPQGALGHGPQIRHFDPTAVSNRRLVRFVEQVAEATGVDIQLAVRRSGGTDAGRIHRSRTGIPTVVIGVPARYIHSHVAVTQMADYRSAVRLVVELVKRLDLETVDGFVRFD